MFATNCWVIATEPGAECVVIDPGMPDVSHQLTELLEKHDLKPVAVIATHGHLDHIGGIPFIMERIGNPPLYTRNLTALMVKKRQAEFPHSTPIDFKIVESESKGWGCRKCDCPFATKIYATEKENICEKWKK